FGEIEVTRLGQRAVDQPSERRHVAGRQPGADRQGLDRVVPGADRHIQHPTHDDVRHRHRPPEHHGWPRRSVGFEHHPDRDTTLLDRVQGDLDPTRLPGAAAGGDEIVWADSWIVEIALADPQSQAPTYQLLTTLELPVRQVDAP